MNVVLFGMLLFLGLAIIGVQFFQGKFHRCYAPPDITPLELLDKTDCIAAGYSCIYITTTIVCLDVCLMVHPCDWLGNNPLDMGHFDHVPAALLIMFELGTQENWNRLMYAAIDARENLHWLVLITDIINQSIS